MKRTRIEHLWNDRRGDQHSDQQADREDEFVHVIGELPEQRFGELLLADWERWGQVPAAILKHEPGRRAAFDKIRKRRFQKEPVHAQTVLLAQLIVFRLLQFLQLTALGRILPRLLV